MALSARTFPRVVRPMEGLPQEKRRLATTVEHAVISSPDTLPPLEYAPGEPARRRRRARRIAGAVLFVIVAGLGIWFGPRLWRRGFNYYAVRQACNFSAPDGTVVYQDAPGTGRPLVANGGLKIPIAGTSPAGSRAAPDPAAFNRLATVAAPGHISPFAPRGPGPSPLVFLHKRTTPDGRNLLVAVRVTGLTYYPWDGGMLACTYNLLLLHPSEWHPPTGVAMIRAWGGVHIPTAAEVNADWTPPPADPAAPAEPGPIRVSFGAPDPNDPSAFTVPYEVNGRRRHWRFRLTNLGATLDEQPVGPTTRP